MEALDVYGGREAVLARMNEMFATMVSDLSEEDIALFRDDLSLDPTIFGPGKEQVTYFVWQRFAGYLGETNIWDALGEQDLSGDGVREWWDDEVDRNPMVVLGEPDARIDVELYVGLRALEEIDKRE